MLQFIILSFINLQQHYQIYEEKNGYEKVCRQDGNLYASVKIIFHALDIMPEVSEYFNLVTFYMCRYKSRIGILL